MEEFCLKEAPSNHRAYKVYYYFYNTVENKIFSSLRQATEFALELPTGAVFEIKRVEDGS